MQQNELGRKQHFAQNGEISFLIIPSENIGAPVLRSNVHSSHRPVCPVVGQPKAALPPDQVDASQYVCTDTCKPCLSARDFSLPFKQVMEDVAPQNPAKQKSEAKKVKP